MCATLHVTPNELLGFAEFNDEGAFQGAPGMAESPAKPPGLARHRQRQRRAHWRGALPARPSPSAASRAAAASPCEDPLANFRETAALFQKLQAEPFGTVAEIVDDLAVKGAARVS